MSTPRVRTAAALFAGLALSVLPVAAQDGRQDGRQARRQEQGAQRSDRPRAERRRPRESGNGSQAGAQRAEPRQAQRAEPSQAQRNNDDNQNDNRGQAVPRGDNRGRSDARRGNESNGRNDDRRADRNDDRRADRNDSRRADRNNGNRDWDNGNRSNGNRDWNNGNRGRDRGRPYAGRPSGPSYRYYNSPRRSYVVPYGYRPYGRRPGWSLNLYFGNPYAYRSGGYYNRGYNNRYSGGNYGYYAIPQGFAYGSLRIVDAPRDAQVFVDGYYAGVVDDYDGVFQRLNLEPGEHQLEVEPYPGAPPLSYDVYVEPGRTVTVHVRP